VKLRNGETWSARTDSVEEFANGRQVRVVRVEGATIVVEPVAVFEGEES